MGILIGMDEAGYGPNLGPLVVAATAWDVVERDWVGDSISTEGPYGASFDVAAVSTSSAAPKTRRLVEPNRRGTKPRVCSDYVDLYDSLGDAVRREACVDERIAIADSKTLYKPGGGLRQLERGVHAVLLAVDRPATRWSAIIDVLDADSAGLRHQLPWHADFDCRLPIDAASDEVTALGLRLSETCAAAGVWPLAIRARYVYPAEFNELTDYYATKGAALSHVTIGLLRELADSMIEGAVPPAEAGSPTLVRARQPPASLHVVCDKHGGRNRYLALLQHHFSETWIDTLVERRAESRYCWQRADSHIEVTFRTGGEAFLPTALASMTAKYLRELAMRAFNQFWCARVPNLRPTAGYPTDARRFRAEIDGAWHTLGLADDLLWRRR